jgi:hypothetical protein
VNFAHRLYFLTAKQLREINRAVTAPRVSPSGFGNTVRSSRRLLIRRRHILNDDIRLARLLGQMIMTTRA